jgi:transcriptional regulator with XRE-family HTH domain
MSTLYGMAKTNLPQRLQTIMDAMGWSQADLARAAKTSRQNVTNWMTEVSGTKKAIEPRFAWAIEDATRFNARWIVYGEGPARMELADPLDEKLLRAISKLPAERKRALSLALDLPL